MRYGNALQVAGVVKESIVDGPGLRSVLFLQGCKRHCPGCHNEATWPLDGGERRSVLSVCKELFLGRDKMTRGLTVSGGEPFLQAHPVWFVASAAKKIGWDVLVYTGFPFEELAETAAKETWEGGKPPGARLLLDCADFLVTDPYEESSRSLNLRWRGSANQRLWRKAGTVWERVEDFS